MQNSQTHTHIYIYIYIFSAEDNKKGSNEKSFTK